ncbi:hypothetical protein [Thermogladius sp.]|jgi:hypothetical protein|uniref:hypothetical protein n=1 Tax=Thermogladius sp. TaxID=2023064 RepID=UPI003D0D11E6
MTSYFKSSIGRVLEELKEKAVSRLRMRGLTLLDVTSFTMRLGERVFSTVSYVFERLAVVLNKIQVRMIEPMIMAAIWSCIVFVVVVLASLLFR